MNKKLEDMIENYDGFFVDIWGVVHQGYEPYVGVINTINEIAKHKEVMFLSNSPRPSEIVLEKLSEYGLNTTKLNIFTSGDLVREQLVKREDKLFQSFGKKFYHLGSENNDDILRGLEVETVDEICDASFILLTLFSDDPNYRHDQIKQALEFNLQMVCANPDQVIKHGQEDRFCAGFYAKKYESMGGRSYYYGKPYKEIFNKVISIMKNKNIVNKNKLLMIGDTLDTDIEGSNFVGIDSMLVLTGNGSNSYAEIGKNHVKPTWITDSLCFGNEVRQVI